MQNHLAKGMKDLFDLSSFTRHIYFSYDIFLVLRYHVPFFSFEASICRPFFLSFSTLLKKMICYNCYFLSRIDKRKHKELGSTPEDKGSKYQKKRKGKNKENEKPLISAEPPISNGDGGRPDGAKRHRRFKYENFINGRSADNGNKRKLIKEPTNCEKEGVELRKTSKKRNNEARTTTCVPSLCISH